MNLAMEQSANSSTLWDWCDFVQATARGALNMGRPRTSTLMTHSWCWEPACFQWLVNWLSLAMIKLVFLMQMSSNFFRKYSSNRTASIGASRHIFVRGGIIINLQRSSSANFKKHVALEEWRLIRARGAYLSWSLWSLDLWWHRVEDTLFLSESHESWGGMFLMFDTIGRCFTQAQHLVTMSSKGRGWNPKHLNLGEA